jgi:hypothetical protein
MSNLASLKLAATLADKTLSDCTGLDDYKRKLVTYWALATHALPNLETFPILSLQGQFGCGKSECLNVISLLSAKSIRITLNSFTLPAVRDAFINAHEGTVLIEEADTTWKTEHDKAFENLLNNRGNRSASIEEHNHQVGKHWERQRSKYFGATVLHRRQPFDDSALESRTIIVKFKAVHTRTYKPYNSTDPLIIETNKAIGQIEKLQLPYFESVANVAGRVMDTYRPCLMLAQYLDDQAFIIGSLDILHTQTENMCMDQGTEFTHVVYSALVSCMTDPNDSTHTISYCNVRLSALVDAIYKESRDSYPARKVGRQLRLMGFTVKVSHGQAVVELNRKSLLSAYESIGYSDPDTLEQLSTPLPPNTNSNRINNIEKNTEIDREGGKAPSSTLSTANKKPN